MMALTLKRTETIVAVVPETASGPGWANRVVWAHIVDSATGEYRCMSIQPHEQTHEMHLLFDIGEQVAKSLIACVPVKREEDR